MNIIGNHWMLDLETLAVAPNAAVIQIGLVQITATEEEAGKALGLSISPAYYAWPGEETHIDYTVQNSTVAFHQRLGPGNAYEEATKIGYTYPDDVRRELAVLMGHLGKSPIIWANGTDFDIPIITNLLQDHGVKPAWRFYNVRDCRTVFKLLHPGIEKAPVAKHGAIVDCVRQIRLLRECGLKELR